jgi:hypothetical protein
MDEKMGNRWVGGMAGLTDYYLSVVSSDDPMAVLRVVWREVA